MLALSFGAHLRFRISELRVKLGTATFNRILREERVSLRAVHRLEDGTWRTINHHTLLVLMALAKGHGVDPFIDFTESAIWSPFYRRTNNLVLAGQNQEGTNFPGDIEVMKVLVDAGISFGFRDVSPSTSTNVVRTSMKETNVLLLGSPKNNGATAAALKVLWSKCPIKFLLPGVVRGGATIAESPNGRRALLLHGNALEENGDKRRIGVVVICRDFDGDGFSTVIVAGCSREATYLMIEEFTRPDFYRVFSQAPVEMNPTLMIFDTGRRRHLRWWVDGSTPPRSRRPGRPRE